MTKSKAKTYTALILILFFKNFNAGEVPCAHDLIVFTDKLAKKLNIKIDITLQTKYAIVRELLESGILFCDSQNDYHNLVLSSPIKKYVLSKQKIISEEQTTEEN